MNYKVKYKNLKGETITRHFDTLYQAREYIERLYGAKIPAEVIGGLVK